MIQNKDLCYKSKLQNLILELYPVGRVNEMIEYQTLPSINNTFESIVSLRLPNGTILRYGSEKGNYNSKKVAEQAAACNAAAAIIAVRSLIVGNFN